MNLHSFADHQCSGTSSCEVVVFELIGLYHPCPRELSSYLEASYICLPGTLLLPNSTIIHFFSFHVNLHSYVDKRCSGKSSCKVKVFELVEHFSPCPKELSSYLEASSICLPGTCFIEPTCAHAQWAHMHRFLSVRCDLTEITLAKNSCLIKYCSYKVETFRSFPLVHGVYVLLKKRQVGSRQCQVVFYDLGPDLVLGVIIPAKYNQEATT